MQITSNILTTFCGIDSKVINEDFNIAIEMRQ